MAAPSAYALTDALVDPEADALARKALRKALRAKRRAVTPEGRARAARQVARNVDRVFRLRPGLRVALYYSFAEELDTAPLIRLARRRGCRVFVPRIDKRTISMKFVEAPAGSREITNRLGIVEPHGTRPIAARWLDLVLMPLVGFDAHGMRLGMGGGYYDRTFAYRNRHMAWRGPRLVGVAYSFQQVPLIAHASHDVRLDAVVTEAGVIRCTTGS
ncbi:MAG: 5-formyltetrahydrofolate cyclo-ligase [Gammaproteobacteria bacterium]